MFHGIVLVLQHGESRLHTHPRFESIFFFRTFDNVCGNDNHNSIGVSLCCNYGIGRVDLPAVNDLLYRRDSEGTYFIINGGGIVNFDNRYCFGFNFTLLVVRLNYNNFVTSVQPTVNCTDPSYNVIAENNLLTVNVTNITSRNSNSERSDRYVVFKDYRAENSSVVVTLAEFFIFDRADLANLNVTVSKCVNADTGYYVPIFNRIILDCSEKCNFIWHISNFIYYTFIVYREEEDLPSDVKCVVLIK